MNTVIVLVISIPLDAFAETVEPTNSVAKLMESPEGIVVKAHVAKSVNGLATISRVAAGASCLDQDIVHSAEMLIHFGR
jgi:hypothetical protein